MAWKSFYLSAGIISVAALPFYAGSSGAAFLPGGPCLVAAHHASFLDGPLLALAYARAKLRPLRLIAYQEPFEHWLMGWILRSGGCIPFKRGDRDSQGRMLTAALGWLAAGEAVGIFPEGHINPTGRLNRPRSGLALLALESGLPIVPAAAPGSEQVWPPGARLPRPGRRARVVFGQPIRLFPKETLYASLPRDERRELIRNLGFRIMTALAELTGKRRWEDGFARG
jgi:1-acyl-sn-glycerol-3-phosphate acyltransferase